MALCAKGARKRFLVGFIVSVHVERLAVYYYASDDEFGQYQRVIDLASKVKGQPWQGEFETKDVVVYFDEFEEGKIPSVAVDQIIEALQCQLN